uniref:NTR domain-containing protein n=1 Tax=Angiostrongylus cantonensis TaxID=6313 RepID=A0A0K0CVX6_ANGCA
MRRIVCLLAFISTAVAHDCSDCYPLPAAHKAFCAADWVSRVKVIDVNNPYEDHSGQFDVVYTIEHVYYYTMPNSYCKLPPLLLAKSDEAQRLNMTAGKEYLLAGSKDCDMALRTSYDVQVNDDGIYGAQEWHNVSETLQQGLLKYNC